MFKREKSIALDKYIAFKYPEYTYLHIIPQKSIRNYNTDTITKTIAHTYKSLNKRVRIEQKKLFFETNFKIGYVIDISSSNADFYFVVPKSFSNLLMEKAKEIWSTATIELMDTPIKEFSKTALRYELSYEKEDALSLNIDKKSNEPLNSILGSMNILKDDDRVTVCYNFIPTSQDRWKIRYDDTVERFKKGKPVDKNIVTAPSILKLSLGLVLNILDSVLEVFCDFLGADKYKEEDSLYNAVMKIFQKNEELSPLTKQKREQNIIQTQIAIVSESSDKVRKTENAISVCQSFGSLDGDNRLIYHRTKSKFKLTDYDFAIKNSYTSTVEASSFVQIPARTLLEEYNINHISIEETSLPPLLQQGYIQLGFTTYRGTKTMAYLEDDREIGSLPLVILGRQGGGKTTYLCNYASYVVKRGESIVHIDYIKNCEASKSIESALGSNNVIVLDFSKEDGLQSFAYNELRFTNDMSWFEKQELANKKSQLVLELVNSINVNGDPLSPKMEKFLMAASDIVNLDDKATLKDIMKCLQNYRFRDKVIKSIPEEIKGALEDEIFALRELDDVNKEGNVIGTRDSKIEGILDRLTLLKRDFYLKQMFNKSPQNNLDFSKALEEGKFILIRMPQAKFKSYVKNVITTFLTTKVWTACEIRGELNERNRRCHLLIDEISQCHTAEMFMESILTQTRKFGLKFVLTGQYLDQLNKKTIYSLKGAGASFMLLTGSIKEDFNYFKDELYEKYTYEDIRKMEKHSSLNIINTSVGFCSFITKLPKPL